MNGRRKGRLALLATLCAGPAPAEWRVESEDGETSIKFGLPPQNALIAEVGYYFQGPRIGLFGQWSGRDFSSPSSLDEVLLQHQTFMF